MAQGERTHGAPYQPEAQARVPPFCRPRLRFLELRILGVMENWLCSC